MHDSLSPLSSVIKSHCTWVLIVDQATDVLVVSKFVPVASSEAVGSSISSTRDRSIVIGMNLIGRYFFVG